MAPSISNPEMRKEKATVEGSAAGNTVCMIEVRTFTLILALLMINVRILTMAALVYFFYSPQALMSVQETPVVPQNSSVENMTGIMMVTSILGQTQKDVNGQTIITEQQGRVSMKYTHVSHPVEDFQKELMTKYSMLMTIGVNIMLILLTILLIYGISAHRPIFMLPFVVGHVLDWLCTVVCVLRYTYTPDVFIETIGTAEFPYEEVKVVIDSRWLALYVLIFVTFMILKAFPICVVLQCHEHLQPATKDDEDDYEDNDCMSDNDDKNVKVILMSGVSMEEENFEKKPLF